MIYETTSPLHSEPEALRGREEFAIERQAHLIGTESDPSKHLKFIAKIFRYELSKIMHVVDAYNRCGYPGSKGAGIRLVAQMLSHLHKDPAQ